MSDDERMGGGDYDFDAEEPDHIECVVRDLGTCGQILMGILY
jgi:hypothetical protein